MKKLSIALAIASILFAQQILFFVHAAKEASKENKEATAGKDSKEPASTTDETKGSKEGGDGDDPTGGGFSLHIFSISSRNWKFTNSMDT